MITRGLGNDLLITRGFGSRLAAALVAVRIRLQSAVAKVVNLASKLA